MDNSTRDPADMVAGVIFVAFGLFFGLQSWGLEMGTTLKMGPGYFPLVLSVLLVGLGIGVLIGGMKTAGAPIGTLALRGMLFILPAPVFFGLTVRGMGFVPSIFLTTLIACFATTRMKPLQAFLLAAGVTVFSTVVFVWALGLPFRTLGPWFDAVAG
jgi:Tripartite tricarboxylate transporter TctB family